LDSEKSNNQHEDSRVGSAQQAIPRQWSSYLGTVKGLAIPRQWECWRSC
jgi:NADH:ubiquinone oxidoreductase subunit